MKLQHSSLGAEDECYFLMEYVPYDTDNDSFSNEQIRDLKKSPDRRDKPEWPYKGLAINDIAKELGDALPGVVDFDAMTIVPIPPSKVRANPFYDDRILQLLYRACPAHADIRELIVCQGDRVAAHVSGAERPGVRALLENYVWNEGAGNGGTWAKNGEEGARSGGEVAWEGGSGPRNTVVLFDDVIVGGNHFVACSRFLRERYPGTRVMGIFVARRVMTVP